MKKITYIILLLLTFNFGFGQTTLSEGDLTITGINADNPDQFSFVLLTDVLSGTQINFTDFGWISTGGFYFLVNEGVVTWTAASDLTCGVEVIIENTGGGSFSATTGAAIQTDAGFTLSTAGDQLLAFQGSLSAPTFLYAVHFGNGNGWSDATDTNNSAVPAGLTNGTNAMDMGSFDNGNYNCSVTTNQSLILEATANPSNWTVHNTNRQTLGGCTYTCTAICASTVTWNGAWVGGTPGLTTEVIIDANYNTSLGSFSACSLTINNGAILTVNDGTFIEVENDVLVNDGELRVNTQGNFVQNDASGTFIVNPSGNAYVNKVTAAKQNWLYYTYWSSPVNGETIAGAFPNTDGDRRFSFNAANYLDEHTVGTTNGIPDDIDDDGNDWTIEPGANTMTPGVGYAATAGPFHIPGATDIATFTGVFNTGNIPTSISYNALNTIGSWNFIGNPYPSAVDFIAFQQANSAVIDGAAYFWSQSLPPDSANPGNQVNNFSQNDYATFTVGTGGVAGADGNIPTQYIPSSQSFFIAGLADGNATFTNAMRMADGTSNTQFFKGSNSKKNTSPISNKLWMNLTSDNGVFNQILVGYVEGATNENDGMSYDAPKLLSSESAILYTSIENSDKIFSVQGKAPRDLSEDEIISIGFKTSIDVATLYTLSIAELQGEFLANSPIYLKDNLLNKTHDLSASDYTFTSEVGEFNSRFQIGFNAQALSTDAFELDESNLSIAQLENDHIQFTVSNNSNIKSVVIFDMLGRQLYNLKGQRSTETYKLSNLNSSIFIAKVELSSGALITKKAVKR